MTRLIRCNLLRAVVRGAAVLALSVGSALAQTQAQVHTPDQPLQQSLVDVARQTGVNILFTLDEVAGLRAGALNGQMTAREAVMELISGTQLEVVTDGTGSLIVRRRAADPAVGTPDVLEQIVVTATKRQVGLQSLPQAVTAITSQRLDELNALSFQDYFRDVPGLMMNTDPLGHLDFSIRGVSDYSASIPQTSATIGQYIDEIPVTTTGAQLDMRLVDIDRIEVLRGPQGTYYGEGSLGGTIRTITKKPDLNNFSAMAEGRMTATEHSAGASDQESVMLNVPLIEGKLALRGNYFYAQDAGFIDIVKLDPVTGRIVGSIKSDADTSRANGGRAMALFAPVDWLSVLAEVIHSKNTVGRDAGYNPAVGDLLAGAVCSSPSGSSPGGGGLGGGSPDGASSTVGLACFNAGRIQKADLDNLTANVDLGWASLVSASSWASTYRNQYNAPLLASGTAPDGDITDGSAFTQELRLVSSTSWSDRWDYLLGTFGSRRHTHDVGQVTHAAGTQVALDQTNKELAFFGEAGYKLNDHWSARLGARAVSLRQEQGVTTTTAQGTSVKENAKRFTPFTGRAVLNYNFDNGALVYGSVSNGFRQGGSNIPSPLPGVSTPATYDPDKATNYELGWKLSLPALQATLNGALYHIDWKNMQSQGVLFLGGSGLQYYRNVGDVAVDGFELESGWQLAQGLRAQLSFSYIYARLAEDYVLSENPRVLHGLKGDKVPFVAPLSGSLSLNYHRPLGASGFSGFVSLNGQYQGKRTTDFNKQFDNAVAQTYAVMDPYWTTGAQLGVENDRWRITIYAENLFDTRAQLYRGAGISGAEITDRPRSAGLALRYNFH